MSKRQKTEREILIEEIESFLAQTGMNPTTFSIESTGERSLMTRVKYGANLKIETVGKIRRFMRDWRPARPRRLAGYQARA